MTKTYIQKDNIATYYYKDEACLILHREDGPAIDYKNGYKAWFLNGKCHRDDGPAVEYRFGTKEWWLNNVKYSEIDFYIAIGRKNLILFL